MKRVLFFVTSSLPWLLLSACTLETSDIASESLRWTQIGAIGSWAGSIFGAMALVISILAFCLPQRVKLKISVSSAFLISQVPGIGRIDTYCITVKNVGMKAATVSNVYLHFGDKKNGDIFVGVLNQGSVLQDYTPAFPKRLEQGECLDYHLLKDKLDKALAYHEKNAPPETPLSIRVDEVTKGTKYYKTKWTLNTFICSDEHQNNKVV